MSKRKQKNIVYIIGPSFRTQGGISSVLLIYHSNFRDALNMRFIPSYSGNSRIADVLLFAAAFVRVFFLCIFKKHVMFHIHSSTYGSFIRKSILAGCALIFNKKVILHIHGADFDTFIDDIGSGWRKRVIKILNKVDRIVVLSESWKQFFLAHVPAEKIRVIVNPSATYDPVYIERSNPVLKVLFIGRIGRRKGAYDLIEAIGKIRSLSFVLDIVGDGEGDAIREIVRADGLERIVHVHDWVSHKEIGRLYDKADILVLPSYSEGLPMSVLEGIGKGLPVISTNVGGIPEAVIDGYNGFIISPGDVDALAEKMSNLIRDTALREEMGRKSLKIAGDKFSIETNRSLLQELYEGLESRTPKVFMVGPSLKTQGGISSVLDIYNRNFRELLNLRFISSYCGRNRMLDVVMFVGALLQVIWTSLFSVNPIFHIHVASKGSYLRKSILARICLAFRHRLILHIHGSMFDQFIESASPEKRKKIIALLNRANCIIVLSKSWFSFFKKYVPGERLRIIYNPSSTYRHGHYKIYKTENPQTDDRAVMQVLFMGRFGQRKGVYDLISAAAKLREIPFKLCLYGDGEIEKVREMVEKEKLNEKVSVNGWVSHSKIREIYENADVMVLPSYAEGLPMSLLEAIGEGLSVVSTRVGGIPEAIEDGRNGFLIEPGDIEALADRLRRLLTSPELVERMGHESLEIVKGKFSIDRIGHELLELYQELEGHI